MSVPVLDPQDPVLVNVTVQVNPLPADVIRKNMIVSAGDTNLTTNTYAAVDRSDYADYFDTTTGNKTYLWLVAFFAQAPGATVYIYEVGAVIGGDPTTNIALLTALISGGTLPVYKYSVPQAFYGAATFATLVNTYNGVTDHTYFSVEITNGVDPAADPNFTPFIGSKAFFPTYGSGVATESIDGAMTGVMASAKYDLSAASPNTMLNYSKLLSITAPSLSNTLRASLNALGVNYAGVIAGSTVIFNGRYADLTAWEYWYGWDWYEINTINALTAAIVNGANNPLARIGYDQNGIDALLATANGVAKTGQSYGTVTDFGSGYNFGTGEIIDSGSFGAEEFHTYIAANPTDYQSGKYAGLYGYMLIGRFIRQIVMNITIN